jgi:hypothetical protein
VYFSLLHQPLFDYKDTRMKYSYSEIPQETSASAVVLKLYNRERDICILISERRLLFFQSSCRLSSRNSLGDINSAQTP